MAPHPFFLVDVFSASPTRGAGLAVILEAGDLSAATMQSFARWIDLAECAFLSDPTDADADSGADYAARIFTPEEEVTFAGHPTLGACAAWLTAGGAPKRPGRVIQSCGVGLVEIDRTLSPPAFVAPPAEISPLPSGRADAIADAIGVPRTAVRRSAQIICGPLFQVLELTDAETVLTARVAGINRPEIAAVGLFGPHMSGEAAIEVRHAEQVDSTGEDPVTGSLNAGIAHWLMAQGRLTAPYVAAQGAVMGREGRVFVTPTGDPSRIMIGGETRIVVRGSIDL